MKIAVISDDGTTISQHFGMAPLYVVATVEKGKVVSKETRNKMGHQHFAGGQHPEHKPGQPHGYDADSQDKHAQMSQNIDDCQVLLAGGMGWGAYDSLKSRGLETIITDVRSIDEAVNTYLKGELPNLMEKLH
jgi:predicted Fe-Mo cluster-binding NifX family protein